ASLVGYTGAAPERLWRHQHARPERLRALDDDPFTRLEAVLDYPHCAKAFPDFDRAAGNPVARFYDFNLVAALQLAYCGLRDKQSASLHADHGVDLRVLPWT